MASSSSESTRWIGTTKTITTGTMRPRRSITSRAMRGRSGIKSCVSPSRLTRYAAGATREVGRPMETDTQCREVDDSTRLASACLRLKSTTAIYPSTATACSNAIVFMGVDCPLEFAKESDLWTVAYNPRPLLVDPERPTEVVATANDS